MKTQSSIKFQKASPLNLNIIEDLDWNANCAVNRAWYRGNEFELDQLYMNLPLAGVRFWGSQSSSSKQKLIKIHTGLPKETAETMTGVVLSDFSNITCEDEAETELWKEIEKENRFSHTLKKMVNEVQYIGDGALKIDYEEGVSEKGLPIVDFYAGDRVEFVWYRGRIKEVIFETVLEYNGDEYRLYETRGKGYIKNKLVDKDGKKCDLSKLPQTEGLAPELTYGPDKFMMAVPVIFFPSDKYEGRGQSIFEHRIALYDALDEIKSQSQTSIRFSKPKRYIPSNKLPQNDETGEILPYNDFDHDYIVVEGDLVEGHSNDIVVIQPDMPIDAYDKAFKETRAACLQGYISESTMGFDDKTDANALAQREKEKVTLATRAIIVDALTEALEELVTVCIKSYRQQRHEAPVCSKPIIDFGEYANDSSENVVATIAQGDAANLFSLRTKLEIYWGKTRTPEWIAEEEQRIKEEMSLGFAQMETEPGFGGDVDYSTGFDFGSDDEEEEVPEDEVEDKEQAEI